MNPNAIFLFKLIFTFFFWCLVSVSFGAIEGYLFYYKYQRFTKSTKKDKHYWFTIQRIIIIALPFVWIIPEFVFPLEFTWDFFGRLILLAVYAASFMLCFPFLHDGSLYYTWNKLSPGTWPMGWKDYDTTPTAKFNFTFQQRLIMVILSIVLVLLTLIII